MEADPKYAAGGPRPTPGTLTKLFLDAVQKFDRPDALRFKSQGKWIGISHREVEERARRVALALRALGVRKGDRVAILSENRPEWLIADYGCLTAQLTDVPIYPTLPAEQIPHILNNSGAVAMFVSTEPQAAKVAEIRGQVPSLRHVISFTPTAPAGVELTFADLLERGRAEESPESIAAWKRDALALQPDDPATLIYTSGTTGPPKGVMLTHDNIFSNVMASRAKLPFVGDDVELSFLPLSHIFQRTFDYLAWNTGTVIAYAESFEAVPINMSEVRPTIMCAVPRLYEKMYARVLENALKAGAVKKRVFFWARTVAAHWTDVTLAGKTPGPVLAWEYGIAQRLVFSKLKERLGGRIRYFVSGSAPLAQEIHKFFYGAGLVILEGYGLTETSPVITVNAPAQFRLGTVGRPVDGVEVRIADDGEILTKGPHVMKGYFSNPQATKDAITDDGWFRTGDIGALDDGFLRITDRKKDLIKTSGGKYLAPQPIENRVKLNKYVAEAVLIGEGRKFPSMLVVPNFEHLERWAAQHNILWTDRSQLLAMPTIQAKMEKEVGEAYVGLAKFETPKKLALLEHEFSIERGELTPSLKVKRKVVDANYKAIIDKLYEEHRP
jgi:long-chain acyl-CoA synthetase